MITVQFLVVLFAYPEAKGQSLEQLQIELVLGTDGGGGSSKVSRLNVQRARKICLALGKNRKVQMKNIDKARKQVAKFFC